MKRNYTPVVFGTFFLSLSVLFALAGANLLGDAKIWQLIWPLAVVAFGVSALIPKGGRIIGSGLILAGAWFFVSELLSINVQREFIIAGIVALVGITIIVYFITNKTSNNSKEDDIKNELIIFGGKSDTVKDNQYKGSDITIIFGGMELDLSKMEIKHDINISVFAMFGGMEITLPKNVRLKLSTSAIFGGVENNAKDEDIEDNAPVVYLSSFTMCGGIEINRKEKKDKK